MNSNWRNRPTTIDYIPKDMGYIICIDESGSPNLKQIIKSKNSGGTVCDNEKHFTVTACCISLADFTKARDLVMDLKKKYWEDALFQYPEGNKRVCFHSRDIRKRRGAFSEDSIEYEGFIRDLSQLMVDVPLTLYASHINKEKHVNQYRYPASPYDLCMTFVLERVLTDIGSNQNCVIVLEARGAKEDKELLQFIKRVIDHGTQYHSADFFSRIKGVYFNPKWSSLASDQMSYWELELADLCAYPIQKYFTYGTRDKAFEALLPKFSCYPNYVGKGLKSFP